jgi:Mrp family chromosome partitioning ATPase
MNVDAGGVTPLDSIVRNLDFALRERKAKTVVVLSELPGEGKTTFITAVVPALGKLYQRKILVLDCGTTDQRIDGVDYLSLEGMSRLKGMSSLEQLVALKSVFAEVEGDYDNIFIDISVPARTGTLMLPDVAIDGAVMVRSYDSIESGAHDVSDLLLDKKIPVLGMVINGGVL